MAAALCYEQGEGYANAGLISAHPTNASIAIVVTKILQRIAGTSNPTVRLDGAAAFGCAIPHVPVICHSRFMQVRQ